MADEVTLTLTKRKHAPWGLLTETEPPQTLVWLTDDKMTDSIPYQLLTSSDIDRIQYAIRCGVISVEGLDDTIPAAAPAPPSELGLSPKMAQQVLDMAALLKGEEPIKFEDLSAAIQVPEEKPEVLAEEIPTIDPIPDPMAAMTYDVSEKEEFPIIDSGTSLKKFEEVSKVADETFLRELKDAQAKNLQKPFAEQKEEEATLRKANIVEKYNALLEKKESNPFLIQTLDQPAKKVRRAIKILARGRVPLEMFKTLLKLEEKRSKPRKTVLKDIRTVIEDRISGISEDTQGPGNISLEDTYHDLIEEEEDGGTEIHYEPIPFDGEEGR